MAFFNFDATAVKPQDSFSPIPAGTYIAQAMESEIKPTKSGTGQMLTVRWQVLDGPHKGRLVFDRINIVNQNPKAEEIGQRQLSSLCHAAGVMKLQDTSQLHNKPVKIVVKIRQDPSFGDSNEVKGYEAVAGMTPAPSFVPATPGFVPPAAPAGGGVTPPPWARAA